MRELFIALNDLAESEGDFTHGGVTLTGGVLFARIGPQVTEQNVAPALGGLSLFVLDLDANGVRGDVGDDPLAELERRPELQIDKFGLHFKNADVAVH